MVFMLSGCLLKQNSSGKEKVENVHTERSTDGAFMEIVQRSEQGNKVIARYRTDLFGESPVVTDYSVFFPESESSSGLLDIYKIDLHKGLIGKTEYQTCDDFFITPDEEIILVCKPLHTKDTNWGPIILPSIEVYNYEKKAMLVSYDTLALLSEDFYGGNVGFKYREKTNAVYITFSLDAFGNYGMAYIDLNTLKLVWVTKQPLTNEQKEEYYTY